MLGRDPFNEHVQLVHAAGIEPPAAWNALYDRLSGAVAAEDTFRAQTFVQAVLSGAPEADIPLLRALSFAETLASGPTLADMNRELRNAVAARLREIYQTVAQKNYSAVQNLFDDAAGAFTKAARILDPETPPADVVPLSDSKRRAWGEAQQHALALTALLPQLRAAAQLPGVQAPKGTTQACIDIGLVVSATDIRRRRVWNVWNTLGARAGRWGALVSLGCRLRAVDLDSFQTYRECQPITEQWVPHGIGHRRVLIDLDDELPQPEPARSVTVH
jgi:hypothetical protein